MLKGQTWKDKITTVKHKIPMWIDKNISQTQNEMKEQTIGHTTKSNKELK